MRDQNVANPAAGTGGEVLRPVTRFMPPGLVRELGGHWMPGQLCTAFMDVQQYSEPIEQIGRQIRILRLGMPQNMQESAVLPVRPLRTRDAAGQ